MTTTTLLASCVRPLLRVSQDLDGAITSPTDRQMASSTSDWPLKRLFGTCPLFIFPAWPEERICRNTIHTTNLATLPCLPVRYIHDQLIMRGSSFVAAGRANLHTLHMRVALAGCCIIWMGFRIQEAGFSMICEPNHGTRSRGYRKLQNFVRCTYYWAGLQDFCVQHEV